MTTTTSGAATSTATYTTPSNIKTTEQYKKEQENAVLNGNGGAMGQTAFLTLFTTQLKNQNPLDPMDNEAFVAQLAQFSQLEATTKMATSLEGLTTSLSSERMASASSMIGKTIAVADGKAILSGGQPVAGNVTLATDVDSITLKVYNSSGSLVRTGEIGAQKAGNFPFTWDGKNSSGNQAEDGVYRIVATTKDMQAELEDGSTVSMGTVSRIGS